MDLGGIVGKVFFFQAEDGIRDIGVTGVQTCALPISGGCSPTSRATRPHGSAGRPSERGFNPFSLGRLTPALNHFVVQGGRNRSEERRVGKECRSRWSPYH